jgi:hypothetical protein
MRDDILGQTGEFSRKGGNADRRGVGAARLHGIFIDAGSIRAGFYRQRA